MMTAEEYREMWAGMDKPARNSFINALRERKPSASQHAETIRTLYYREYGKKIGSCINCLLSAHFDIVNGNIKGLNFMENKETKIEKKYDVRPGVVLYDRQNKSVAKIATCKNITEDLARYHLATNPSALKYFTKYPENWKEEAVAYAEANGIATPLKAVETPKEVETPEAAETPETPETEGLTEEEKAKIAKTYERTPVAKTGRPTEK